MCVSSHRPSQEVAVFLTGRSLPAHITGLPAEVLNSPMGPLLRSMLDGVAARGGPGFAGGVPAGFGGFGAAASPAALSAAARLAATNHIFLDLSLP